MSREVFESQLFGSGALFFPVSIREKNGFVEWRDPHPCKKCGALVLYPQAHVGFHQDLEDLK